MFNIQGTLLEDKRIFVIEDDVVNLAVINRVLNAHRARIYQNYNSVGIVVHVTQNLPIDLVILDIMLRRGVNGFDIARDLRANPQTAQIPIVAVSSLDPEVAIPQAKEAGCNGFISKPINSLTFASNLVSIMEGKERWITSR